MPRPDDAEDLLQETFARALRVDGLRDPERARSYLFTTAHHVLVNHARRNRVAEAAARTVPLARSAHGPGGDSPESLTHAREIARRVREAVGRMTGTERRAFELAVLQKHSYEDVARELGWSRTQVKVYVHRARKRALESLAEYVGGAGADSGSGAGPSDPPAGAGDVPRESNELE